MERGNYERACGVAVLTFVVPGLARADPLVQFRERAIILFHIYMTFHKALAATINNMSGVKRSDHRDRCADTK